MGRYNVLVEVSLPGYFGADAEPDDVDATWGSVSDALTSVEVEEACSEAVATYIGAPYENVKVKLLDAEGVNR